LFKFFSFLIFSVSNEKYKHSFWKIGVLGEAICRVIFFDLFSNLLILFLRNPKPFDWYQDYDGVKDIVTQFIKKDSKILNVGCGNSR